MMRTILIPVDFSETSSNALKYATELIKDIDVERIILLKVFYKSVYEQFLPTADFIQLSDADIAHERAILNDQLRTLTDKIMKTCKPSVSIQKVISDLPLLRAIHEIITAERPDLLLIGSDHPQEQQESYIGQQVIGIAKTSPVPVLIIPAGATYKKINQALLPCDFARVSRLNLLNGMKSPLNWFHPQLLVLNIDPKQQHLLHRATHENALQEVLEGYNYKLYYSQDEHTVSGILNFALHNEVQLIIALPGKYSFFYQLTHSSTTEALALNSQEPVLILK